jgi:hypothetical protein
MSTVYSNAWCNIAADGASDGGYSPKLCRRGAKLLRDTTECDLNFEKDKLIALSGLAYIALSNSN